MERQPSYNNKSRYSMKYQSKNQIAEPILKNKRYAEPDRNIFAQPSKTQRFYILRKIKKS